jgi:hypothetical protein
MIRKRVMKAAPEMADNPRVRPIPPFADHAARQLRIAIQPARHCGGRCGPAGHRSESFHDPSRPRQLESRQLLRGKAPVSDLGQVLCCVHSGQFLPRRRRRFDEARRTKQRRIQQFPMNQAVLSRWKNVGTEVDFVARRVDHPHRTVSREESRQQVRRDRRNLITRAIAASTFYRLSRRPSLHHAFV